jgi:predicted porin
VAPPISAQPSDPAPEPPPDVQRQLDELAAFVDELEQREAPPSADELDQLTRVAEALRDGLERRRTEGGEENAQVRQARRLLNRVSGLLLIPGTLGLHSQLSELGKQESPVTKDQLEALRTDVTTLRGRTDDVLVALDPELPGKPKGVREAQRVVARFQALELEATLWEIEPRLAEAEQRSRPPTAEELARVRDAVEEIRERIASIEAGLTDGAGPAESSLEVARRMAERLAVLELLPEVHRLRPVVEEMESRETDLDEWEMRRVETTAEELTARIEKVRPGTLDRFDPDAPPAVRQARELLRRLISLELKPIVVQANAVLQDLERSEEPPSEEELAPQREHATRLLEAIQGFQERPEIDFPEGDPDMVRQARELLWRFALVDLRRSVADIRPIVEQLEAQKDKPTEQQLVELNRLAEAMQPKLRLAQGKDEAEAPDAAGEEDQPEVMREARDLMQRTRALQPSDLSAPEEGRDAPVTQPFLRPFQFYGSLRLTGLDDETSRVGFRAGANFSKRFGGFVRLEVAVNPLTAVDEQLDSGDPGFDEKRLRELFPPRLVFGGLESPWGNLSYGKQWSAFWDVAVFSDQLPVYTGLTSGTFNLGDGSISGTGRPDRAWQYRVEASPYRVTAQLQSRNLTENNQRVADTMGGSIRVARKDGIDVGGAFNVVRDGVPDPSPDEPKQGDRAFIVGARSKNERRYAGLTLSYTENHYRDDMNRFFDGLGVEVYSDYLLWAKLRLRFVVDWLEPTSDHPGEYRLAHIVFGASYDLPHGLRIFLLPRLDLSRTSDGTDRDDNSIAVILLWNF